MMWAEDGINHFQFCKLVRGEDRATVMAEEAYGIDLFLEKLHAHLKDSTKSEITVI